jgi:hypothetical protein
MASFITTEGMYYESEYQIQPSDIHVPPRPSNKHHYINGHWINTDRSYDSQENSEIPDDGYNVNIHRMRVRPNSNHVYQPYQPQQPYMPPLEMHHKQEDQKSQKEETTLNSNTRVMFGIRELLMVGAFVITATVSWQDTNARIVKLEDSKYIESIDSKVKLLEAEIKAMEKQNRSDIQKVDQTIRELEQIIFIKNKK